MHVVINQVLNLHPSFIGQDSKAPGTGIHIYSGFPFTYSLRWGSNIKAGGSNVELRTVLSAMYIWDLQSLKGAGC